MTVPGRSGQQSIKDRVVPLPGNIEGVGKDVADKLTTPPLVPGEVPAELIKESRRGDTLAGIAELVYGNALLAGRIRDANRELIRDTEGFRPGVEILVPKDWGQELST